MIYSEQLEYEEIVLYVVGTENVSTLYDIQWAIRMWAISTMCSEQLECEQIVLCVVRSWNVSTFYYL